MPKGDRLVNMRLDAETKELLRRLAEQGCSVLGIRRS
jgi:hypothetical protein